MSAQDPKNDVSRLESLLFKATNPANKIEDVNTIKQFTDAVADITDGSVIACRILAHKIQSPQEREAVQALAVLEACVRSCGTPFHAEVGKFKFLNEIIKLISPKYLAKTTPQHIKKKVIELLYKWTKEIKTEPKITEAYDMLKKQGIIREDPVYVGEAVFASSLPPRQDAPLSEDQSRLLKRLLQSKNPEDLQQANKIIKGMVKEDERKMDALTKRHTELIMVNNNSKLLNEMLDHYDKGSSGVEEEELLKELFNSCEKMQPKLFRLASETEEGDETIAEILAASDELSRVIDRYKMVIVSGKPDIARAQSHPDHRGRPSRSHQSHADQLLDLDPGSRGGGSSSDGGGGERGGASSSAASTTSSQAQDDDFLNFGFGPSTTSASASTNGQTTSLPAGAVPKQVLPGGAKKVRPTPESKLTASEAPPNYDDLQQGEGGPSLMSTSPAATGGQQQQPSIDDLLNGCSLSTQVPALITTPDHSGPSSGGPSLLSNEDFISSLNMSKHGRDFSSENPVQQKSSRQRGLEELDFLGESAIQSVLSTTARSPQFAKKEKVPLSQLQMKKRDEDLKKPHDPLSQSQSQRGGGRKHSEQSEPLLPGAAVPVVPAPMLPNSDLKSGESNPLLVSSTQGSSTPPAPIIPEQPPSASSAAEQSTPAAADITSKPAESVKLSDLEVPLSSIRPGSTPPMTIQDSPDGVCIILNFGQDKPRDHVSALVVTIINKSPEPMSDFELKAVVPKGCKVKLQPASGKQLPAHNPFVPPSAITQVMLIANPNKVEPVSLKYVLSYVQDEEAQTEMGQVAKLPI